MGSIDKACIAGFLCRLCSEMHRTVIHIYGDQGQKHGLVEKINGYLPVTITPNDPLPKTICEACLRRVEQHYELLVRITQIKQKQGHSAALMMLNRPPTSRSRIMRPRTNNDTFALTPNRRITPQRTSSTASRSTSRNTDPMATLGMIRDSIPITTIGSIIEEPVPPTNIDDLNDVC